MENYDYQSETVVSYLPNEIDLTRAVKLSEDMLRREYVEIYPASRSVSNITGTSTSNTTEIKLSDPSRWIDTSTMYFSYQVSVPQPAGGTGACGNFCVLDGPYANLARVNATVGGQSVTSGIQDINKVYNAKYLNEAMTSNYLSDGEILNPGLVHYNALLKNNNGPMTTEQLYTAMANSPYNMFVGGNGNTSANDALGFKSSIDGSVVGVEANGWGYHNVNDSTQGTQQVNIKLGDIVPLFSQMRYIPLFLLKDIVLQFYWASPVTSFCSDYNLGGTSQNIPSYNVSGIKLVCDLISTSDVLTNAYRQKALSPEGILLPYDDYAVQSTTLTNYAGSQRSFQANLTTNNLKSALMFQQSNKVANAQNAFSNSNFFYLGTNNINFMINNSNIPSNPLNTVSDIVLYNNRSRGVLGNQLSNFVANNKYICYANECAPTATPADTDVNASFVSFMVYSNFEKVINENPEVISNGVSLKDGNSTLTVKWNENNDVSTIPSAIRTCVVGANGYTVRLLMSYQRVLALRNGMIDLVG